MMPDSPLYPSRVPVLRHAFAIWRWIRRLFSRREFTVRMLGLPVFDGTADEPGLIILQIDGLSRQELERALAQGRMPYLRRLIRRERLQLHTLYSGQPATTPAVLGEFFYGVRQAVPAFSFRDHRSGEVVQMIEPEIATVVQDELARAGEGLLADGSAYCDIYSGGAAESQFCSGSMRWSALDDVAVWKKVLLILLNAAAVLRILAYWLAEIGHGLIAIVRSPIGRREWKYELPYIPRLMIGNVLIRETTAIAAEADATRGLPIVHANFLGYDELAHRRGPASSYAHRGLRGIDRALRRIGNAALGSRRRSYRIWVMSDHGQETTAIYDQEFGRTITEAVAAVYETLAPSAPSTTGTPPRTEQDAQGMDGSSSPLVVAVGPLGYVYWPEELPDDEIASIGQRFVRECHVPLVMARHRGEALAWTSQGVFHMPADAGQILGPDHPHLSEVARDLTDLLDHPDAGNFLISGWRRQALPISFVAEHGAHGGPGPLETSGFALLSPDARPPRDRTLRPIVLRELVKGELARDLPSHPAALPRSAGRPIRIMTYNVHSCIGLDGRLSPQRIARVLADFDPDIVALQELDVGRARTGRADQAAAIAAALRMDLHFGPCLEATGELYGNAVLSRLPMTLIKAERFPVLSDHHEQRGALWVKVQDGEQSFDVITTHLGLTRPERARQVERLLGPDWIQSPHCGPNIILCGDFNAGPASRVYRRLSGILRDAQLAGGRRRPRRTWFGPLPLAALDHVFVSPNLDVAATDLAATATARIASDHLPLIVDLRFAGAGEPIVSGPVCNTREHQPQLQP
jgi:endonuclease/exonuclease/phosphatase family metal-dependent hydrolase